MKPLYMATALAALTLSFPSIAQAQNVGMHAGHHHQENHHMGHMNHGVRTAPASVMGDHMHKEGEWMLSYRYMQMHMQGNRDGTNSLSPAEISGVYANRFGTPATLRIVPTEMDMDMHMFGAMYAPRDWLTMMVMGSYQDKEMDHIIFAAGNAAQKIGNYTTSSKGWGDTKVKGFLRAYDGQNHDVHLQVGVSLPTGAIDKETLMLNPMNNIVRMRMPYGMQLGSGTYDLLPGVTYTGSDGDFGWGAQYSADIRTGRNREGYTLGNKHMLDSWVGYKWQPHFATMLKISAEYESDIDGRDMQIAGPVQGADPENYGGKRVAMGLGVNYAPDFGFGPRGILGADITIPVYQNLNGPQMERDYTAVLSYQIGF